MAQPSRASPHSGRPRSSPAVPRGLVPGLSFILTPSSGWVLQTATGINDQGQIVGENPHNGVPHGYLFTPAQQPIVCC